jgi:hypothetical protein
MDPKELDEVLNQELEGFNKWFVQKQKDSGASGLDLIGPERGVVKAYLIYAATKS